MRFVSYVSFVSFVSVVRFSGTGMTCRSAARGIGGEHFVGAAARVSGGEAHDLPYRNIRRRTAEAALHQHKGW